MECKLIVKTCMPSVFGIIPENFGALEDDVPFVRGNFCIVPGMYWPILRKSTYQLYMYEN